MTRVLQTGQTRCFDVAGRPVPCRHTGQDAEFATGMPWPMPRFATRGALVEDRLTGLLWSGNANPAGFPMSWQEALDFVARLGRDGWLDRTDWRLPNRHELRSLLSHETRRPALPGEHPFAAIFPSWYWTSTTVAGAPAHAWYLNMDGARTFFGGKDQSFLVWPVCGPNVVLPRTGQWKCHVTDGRTRDCEGSGEDGELRTGRPWPEPRLVPSKQGIEDRLTGLIWHPEPGLQSGLVSWPEALELVASLGEGWRLPNINELDSIVDCGRFAPALPGAHPVQQSAPAYWSSTTSMFEPDWAWALYAEHGAIGVGQKAGRHFWVWPTRGATRD